VKVGDIFIVLALTCVWILLREDLTGVTILTGLFFSVITYTFCRIALPPRKTEDVAFSKLALYPLYLIGQVYFAGFSVIKLIFCGAEVEIVKLKTELKSESLRSILVDSITLIPGSILIKLDGGEFTLLWLSPKGYNVTPAERDEKLKGDMERWLLKAQK
jgi:multisubunit Na+/H+ antiporter MnhE subunit